MDTVNRICEAAGRVIATVGRGCSRILCRYRRNENRVVATANRGDGSGSVTSNGSGSSKGGKSGKGGGGLRSFRSRRVARKGGRPISPDLTYTVVDLSGASVSECTTTVVAAAAAPSSGSNNNNNSTVSSESGNGTGSGTRSASCANGTVAVADPVPVPVAPEVPQYEETLRVHRGGGGYSPSPQLLARGSLGSYSYTTISPRTPIAPLLISSSASAQALAQGASAKGGGGTAKGAAKDGAQHHLSSLVGNVLKKFSLGGSGSSSNSPAAAANVAANESANEVEVIVTVHPCPCPCPSLPPIPLPSFPFPPISKTIIQDNDGNLSISFTNSPVQKASYTGDDDDNDDSKQISAKHFTGASVSYSNDLVSFSDRKVDNNTYNIARNIAQNADDSSSSNSTDNTDNNSSSSSDSLHASDHIHIECTNAGDKNDDDDDGDDKSDNGAGVSSDAPASSADANNALDGHAYNRAHKVKTAADTLIPLPNPNPAYQAYEELRQACARRRSLIIAVGQVDWTALKERAPFRADCSSCRSMLTLMQTQSGRFPVVIDVFTNRQSEATATAEGCSPVIRLTDLAMLNCFPNVSKLTIVLGSPTTLSPFNPQRKETQSEDQFAHHHRLVAATAQLVLAHFGGVVKGLDNHTPSPFTTLSSHCHSYTRRATPLRQLRLVVTEGSLPKGMLTTTGRISSLQTLTLITGYFDLTAESVALGGLLFRLQRLNVFTGNSNFTLALSTWTEALLLRHTPLVIRFHQETFHQGGFLHRFDDGDEELADDEDEDEDEDQQVHPKLALIAGQFIEVPPLRLVSIGALHRLVDCFYNLIYLRLQVLSGPSGAPVGPPEITREDILWTVSSLQLLTHLAVRQVGGGGRSVEPDDDFQPQSGPSGLRGLPGPRLTGFGHQPFSVSLYNIRSLSIGLAAADHQSVVAGWYFDQEVVFSGLEVLTVVLRMSGCGSCRWKATADSETTLQSVQDCFRCQSVELFTACRRLRVINWQCETVSKVIMTANEGDGGRGEKETRAAKATAATAATAVLGSKPGIKTPVYNVKLQVNRDELQPQQQQQQLASAVINAELQQFKNCGVQNAVSLQNHAAAAADRPIVAGGRCDSSVDSLNSSFSEQTGEAAPIAAKPFVSTENGQSSFVYCGHRLWSRWCSILCSLKWVRYMRSERQQ